MRTLVVIFSILLGILLLISALGGSLNFTERFEDYGLVNEEPETFTDYLPEQEEQPNQTQTMTSPTTPPPSNPSPTHEGFGNPDDVEPYEDTEQLPSFASLQ